MKMVQYKRGVIEQLEGDILHAIKELSWDVRNVSDDRYAKTRARMELKVSRIWRLLSEHIFQPISEENYKGMPKRGSGVYE